MASDLWAIGCSLFELLSLQLPFEAANLPCLLVKITTATAAPRPNCNSQVGPGGGRMKNQRKMGEIVVKDGD
jgi:serine/threonine protein kinase